MVTTRRRAEFRFGLGLFAFFVTVVSLAVFIDFPGTALAGDAAWTFALGILLVALFFYLLLPGRQTGSLPEKPRKRRSK